MSRQKHPNKVELLRRAEELIAAGSTQRDAAMKIGVSHMTLSWWRNPAKYELFKEYARKRHATREKVKSTREQNIRKARRRASRVEAAATGQPVEEIYKRWGVA